MSTKANSSPSPSGSHLVTVWVPKPLVAAIDGHATANDTDRSKWIRDAIREKAKRERVRH